MTLKLPRAGREFSKWPVSTPDTLTNFQVQLIPGGPWVNATYAGGVVSLLVQGPDYVDSPPDGLGTLVAADCRPLVRCIDSPETVIRQGSWIELV